MADSNIDWEANARCGWAALANIREVLTAYAPAGSLPSAEYADGPEHVHEAEQLNGAIHAIVEAYKNETEKWRQSAEEALKLIEDYEALIENYKKQLNG